MKPRLKTVFDAGSTTALFPVLSDWSVSELEALLKDVEEYCEQEEKRIAEVWKAQAFTPEFFFSKSVSKALDGHRDAAIANLIGIGAEISSVALHYLEKHKQAALQAGDLPISSGR